MKGIEKSSKLSSDQQNKFSELLNRSNIDPDDIAKIDRMNVWQSAKKGEDGEWDVQDLYGMQVVPKLDDDDALNWQAASATINYTRRRRAKKTHEKTIAVFSDLQAGYRRVPDQKAGEEARLPLHDERAMQVARLAIADVMPDLIVNLGDSVDLASLSHFKPDSNHFQGELGPAFQRVHDYYAELRADNPKARMVEVSSNHNQRLNDYVLKNFPQAYDLHRPGDEDGYPVLSYPYLANLEDVGVEWKGGYPAGEFEYGAEYDAPPIVFRHGTQTSQDGTTAAKIMKKYPETHNVNGHDHTTGEAWHTLRSGKQLGTFVVGCLCRIDGVVASFGSSVGDDNKPVHHQENWQQSIMIIHDHQDGSYDFDRVRIEDGVAHYNGKAYQADDDAGIDIFLRDRDKTKHNNDGADSKKLATAS